MPERKGGGGRCCAASLRQRPEPWRSPDPSGTFRSAQAISGVPCGPRPGGCQTRRPRAERGPMPEPAFLSQTRFLPALPPANNPAGASASAALPCRGAAAAARRRDGRWRPRLRQRGGEAASALRASGAGRFPPGLSLPGSAVRRSSPTSGAGRARLGGAALRRPSPPGLSSRRGARLGGSSAVFLRAVSRRVAW